MDRIRLTSAQAVVRFLQAQWSERDGERRRLIPAMFGIFGHGNLCGLGQALDEPGSELAFHQPKHEQGMVHAALGYAKATRRMATFACTASIGPGALNMVTGAGTATTNRLPVLLLPADTFANRRQGHVLQQLEHPVDADVSVNDCFRPVSRYFDRISRPEQLLTALPEAMRVLTDPADTGAVTISLPQDVQGEVAPFPVALFAERTWHVDRRPPGRGQLDAAVALLASARRPLIVAGGGVHHSDATAGLAELADRCGIPVAETSAGKGALAIESALALGGIGVNGNTAANALAADADVVLCVGTRLTDFTTASLSLFQDPDVRFIGLNVNAADAHKLGGAPLVADARAGLAALCERLDPSERAERRRQARATRREWSVRVAADVATPAGAPLAQGAVLRAINGQARPGDWVVAAAGGPPGDLLRIWECQPGTRAHIEFGFSCMGHEIPAAIGIRLAAAEAGQAGQVVAVVGDGTYLMANSELVTAVQDAVPIAVVVLVNHGYQSIHALQRATTARSLGNEFRTRRDGELLAAGDVVAVDYAANARSLGCAATSVASLAELRDALTTARDAAGPIVVAVDVDPRAQLTPSGAFWDLGVPEVSARPETAAAAARLVAERARQRTYL